MGIGVSRNEVNNAANIIGRGTLKSHFRYLGVMVSTNRSRNVSWTGIIQKLKERLSKWKLKTLSIGGRLTLLKSVLGSTPVYTMTILQVMETIRNSFLNGKEESEKRITWVAWKRVLASKEHGGLGVSSFYALNRALLCKWVWRFLKKENSMWYRFINAMYGSDLVLGARTTSNSIWGDILKEIHKLKQCEVDFVKHCRKKIGNEETTSFWDDNWIGEVKLKERFPRVYVNEINKHVLVAEKLRHPMGIIAKRRSQRMGLERSQAQDLQSIINDVNVVQMEDQLVWDLSGDGVFQVKDVRKWIDDTLLPKDENSTRWVKVVPIKVNILAWKISLDRIATKANLLNRGVHIQDMGCSFCSCLLEDSSHLFFRCPFASLIRAKICDW